LEKESCYKIPKFDIYSTGGHGTLSEMSIAELRERLVQVKKWHQEEKERKQNIVHEKNMEVNFIPPFDNMYDSLRLLYYCILRN
jgi:hypothetical protein